LRAFGARGAASFLDNPNLFRALRAATAGGKVGLSTGVSSGDAAATRPDAETFDPSLQTSTDLVYHPNDLGRWRPSLPIDPTGVRITALDSSGLVDRLISFIDASLAREPWSTQ
jgi:hypothetical protein